MMTSADSANAPKRSCAMRLHCAAPLAALPRSACVRRRQVHAAAAAHSPQTPPAARNDVPRRAALLLPAALACAPPKARAEASPLWERLERRQLDKPVFNLPPSIQLFPDWLEGTWDVDAKFAGYAFPSKKIDKACVGGEPAAPRLADAPRVLRSRVVSDPTIPGFQKLSIAYIPDVGSGATHQLRFVRRADGKVIADRAFDLKSIIDGYLGKPIVEEVEYAPEREPNRATVRLAPGGTVNAERLELFSNARESALRDDGVFFALESLRQVTLGYTTSFNTPRVAVTDYLQVWTYRLLPDGNSVRATLSTAGYVQPNEAMRYTAPEAVRGGGAPQPQLSGLLSAATEPVVLFSHTLAMRRAGTTAQQ